MASIKLYLGGDSTSKFWLDVTYTTGSGYITITDIVGQRSSGYGYGGYCSTSLSHNISIPGCNDYITTNTGSYNGGNWDPKCGVGSRYGGFTWGFSDTTLYGSGTGKMSIKINSTLDDYSFYGTYTSVNDITVISAPTLSPLSVTNVTDTSCDVSFEISDNGGREIQENGKQIGWIPPGADNWQWPGWFTTSETITGLQPNTSYGFLGWATNDSAGVNRTDYSYDAYTSGVYITTKASITNVALSWDTERLTPKSKLTVSWKCNENPTHPSSPFWIDFFVKSPTASTSVKFGGVGVGESGTRECTVKLDQYNLNSGDDLYAVVYGNYSDGVATLGRSSTATIQSVYPGVVDVDNTSIELEDASKRKYRMIYSEPSYGGVNGITGYCCDICSTTDPSNIVENVFLDDEDCFIFPDELEANIGDRFVVFLHAVSTYNGVDYLSDAEVGAATIIYYDGSSGPSSVALAIARKDMLWENFLNPTIGNGTSKCRLSRVQFLWQQYNQQTHDDLEYKLYPIEYEVQYSLWDLVEQQIVSQCVEKYEYEEIDYNFDLTIDEILSKFPKNSFEDNKSYKITCCFLLKNEVGQTEVTMFEEKIYPLVPENASNVRYVTLPRSYQSPFDVTFEALACDVYRIGVYKVSEDNFYELLGESDFENSDILYDGSTYSTQFYMSEIGILEENVKGNERVIVGVSPVNVVGNISDSGDVEVVNEYASNDVIYTDTVAIFAVVYQNIKFKIKPSQTPENDNVTYPVWLVYKDKNGIIQTKDVTNDVYLCYMKTNWDDVITLLTSEGERLTDSGGTLLVVI